MPGMAHRIGVDLTACWRPRVGMVTLSLELTRAMLDQGGPERSFTLFCSGARPAAMEGGCHRAVLSPHRHEIPNKLHWLPSVEASADLDVMLYPYWPSPPRRRRGAPPAAVFVHDLAFRVRPDEVPWQQRLYLGSLLPAALRQAALVLVPSQATRHDLVEGYPVPGLRERVHVVPQASFLTSVEEGSLPEGLEPGYILAVGTIEPRKNYPRLLAAHRLLRQRRAVPPLVVAGKAGWAYGRGLHDLETDPEVRVLGHVNDQTLLALYRKAAALAFPSLYEGFGLPLLEAMQEGLPALIGDAGSLPELAGGAALAVAPTDVESIADGLARLLDDSELRHRLADLGRRRAADFAWAASGRRTLELLDTVA
jgi:glycosyltransferase involved in cell wall biosynthesis